jgi:hypothetical protein
MTPVGHGALITCAVLAVICAVLWQRQLALRRAAFIRRFELPKGLFDRLRASSSAHGEGLPAGCAGPAAVLPRVPAERPEARIHAITRRR